MSNDAQIRPFQGIVAMKCPKSEEKLLGDRPCPCNACAERFPGMGQPGSGEVQEVQTKIAAAVAEDKKCRVPGITGGIYAISTLLPFSRLPHGVPTIRHRLYSTKFFKQITFDRAGDAGHFRERLRHAAPVLESFDLARSGLCIAGGSVSALVMRSDKDRASFRDIYHDFDLFLVGHPTNASAKKAITSLAEHLLTELPEAEIQVYRTQGCITFHVANIDEKHFPSAESREYNANRALTIQVILRHYSTKAEVIHGFDLGSCAFLWDGEGVYTTAVGKLAAEHGVNVLNLDARRASYERRLQRYFDRGFDLVLPHLDTCGLISRDGRLPYLWAQSLMGSCPCCLIAQKLYATRPGYSNTGYYRDDQEAVGTDRHTDDALLEADKVDSQEQAASDYGVGEIAYGNPRSILMRNIRALNADVPRPASMCASAILSAGLDIFGIDPTFDFAQMTYIATDAILGGEKVKIKALKAMLGTDATAEIMLDYISTDKKPTPKELERRCVIRSNLLTQKAHIPFEFMKVEDKTALTGPFPRTLISLEDWYGDVMVGAAFRDKGAH